MDLSSGNNTVIHFLQNMQQFIKYMYIVEENDNLKWAKLFQPMVG